MASLRRHRHCHVWATLSDLFLSLPKMKTVRNFFLLIFFIAFFKQILTVLAIAVVLLILAQLVNLLNG